MKKYFIFAAAAIVAASCAKTPAPVQTPDGPEAPAVEGKVAVQFGTNVSASVETKSEGSVDAWNGQQKLYIYGLKRINIGTTESQNIKNLYKTPFIANVGADSPSTPSESNAIKVLQVNNEPYYYDGNSTYDFFGYYVDDAAASTAIQLNPAATQGDVTDSAYVLPININGGQDILLAKASADYAFNKLTSENKKKYWTNDNTHTQEWTPENNTWKEKYAFSAYAARREVHPYLVFEHQLTQIQFYVTSGTQFTHTGDEGQPVTDAPALSVTDVTFLNVATKANLYVASGKIPEGLYDAAVDDATKDIAVTQATAGDDPTRTPLTPVIVPNKTENAKPIGAPTMLIPAAEYSVVIKLSQDPVSEGGTSATQTIERTLKIGDVQVKVADDSGNQPDAPGYTETWKKISELEESARQKLFTAGYRYNVNIKVYGLESVDITAELAPWKDGGKIDIDTDEAPEF